LWDCQGKDIKGLLTELKAYLRPEKCFKRVILFNVPPMLEFIKSLTSIGVRGFFYEHDSLANFLKGIKAVIEGKLWLSRDIMTKCIFEGTGKDNSAKSRIENLSQRQIEILALIAVGATNDDISDKLCISPHTVKNHLYSIFKKINVPNRVQAALWAAGNL
jgi:DNA-binding NarL/FixJ family response regulator